MTTPYLTRHLTIVERRRIAHALRQLAEAARHASSFDPPPGMATTEVQRRREAILAEAQDHDRLAGEIERNGLRFIDPEADTDSATKEGTR